MFFIVSSSTWASTGGAGGNGVTSSITGSSVLYGAEEGGKAIASGGMTDGTSYGTGGRGSGGDGVSRSGKYKYIYNK